MTIIPMAFLCVNVKDCGDNLKKDIKSYTLEKLNKEIKEMGLPSFRAKQIFKWLHQRFVVSFNEMSDLSLNLREQLDEKFYINRLEIKRKLVSKIDGTTKYLFKLLDGETIESVVMKYKYGNTICISSQVGCKMGCKFCASTLGGKVRNLSPAELEDQIIFAQNDLGEKISNIVMMGIGEPLDNFDNVCDFLENLSCKEGQNISHRHLSLSTCGVCDKIEKLAEKKLQLTLSVSLHAPTDEIRNTIMPINIRWNIDKLLDTCKKYINSTGRRISFEYALIHGVNDSDECAKILSKKLKGMLAHVNLIPVNEVKEREFEKSTKLRVQSFCDILNKNGITATVRRKLGADIEAACGQLRRESINNNF